MLRFLKACKHEAVKTYRVILMTPATTAPRPNNLLRSRTSFRAQTDILPNAKQMFDYVVFELRFGGIFWVG